MVMIHKSPLVSKTNINGLTGLDKNFPVDIFAISTTEGL
jgi:hypothetical protein